jgi:hypothetical protein
MPASQKDHIRALSQLALNPSQPGEALEFASQLDSPQLDDFLRLADSHHVVIRSFSVLHTAAQAAGDECIANWTQRAIDQETNRIASALERLHVICRELEDSGCAFSVIKSLDHWPDFGNDLDLYTTADGRRIVEVFTRELKAQPESRSWGDRLANKWNFRVPGLRESVEVHVQRLGQTGEHTAMARRLITCRRYRELMGYDFPIPAPEERIIVATLQRLYRHFYFRVCDIANTAALIENDQVDFSALEKAARLGGIWPGVCTYLKIASDYVAQYRGAPLELPRNVVNTALFGGKRINARGLFLRIPIVPHCAYLYTRQVKSTAMRGDVSAAFRLSLLPPLASMAAVAFKVTGSDKGIW